MSLTPENLPNGMSDVHELDPLVWLGPKNARTIIHIGRSGLLAEIRSTLEFHEPQLAINGGLAYYETYGEDASHYGVLLATHPDIATPDATVISINKTRQPDPDEPFFPDGRVLELTDLTFHNNGGKWMNFGWQTLYRGHRDHAWDLPTYATLLAPWFDKLRLFGNLSNGGDFLPTPANDLQEVEDDAEILWTVYEALRLCNASSLNENITSIAEN